MRNRRSASGAAIMLGIVAALLAACSHPSPDPSPTTTLSATSPDPAPSPTPSPTPSVDPTVAAAEAAILEAYRGYWDVQIEMFADPSKDQGADLGKYAVDTAFSDVAGTVLYFRQQGIRWTGKPTISPKVSDVVIGQSATITDCVDSTDWLPVRADTGDPAAVAGQAPRVVGKSSAYYYDNHWVIRTSTLDRSTTC